MSDEVHYLTESESTMARSAILRGTTPVGQRTFPFEVLDLIKTQGPVSAYVVLRAQHNNYLGRYQHLGNYFVCYRHDVSLQRLDAQLCGHRSITIDELSNGMVVKDYSTSHLVPTHRQKVGHQVYYLNIVDIVYSQNARELASNHELNWPAERCNACKE